MPKVKPQSSRKHMTPRITKLEEVVKAAARVEKYKLQVIKNEEKQKRLVQTQSVEKQVYKLESGHFVSPFADVIRLRTMTKQLA